MEEQAAQNLENTECSSTQDPEKTQKLEWNLIGWYASSLGAACWMNITPFFLNWPTKGVWAGLVGTLAIWSFASLAWSFRAKISAFAGIIYLIGVTVLSNLGFLLFAHANKLPLAEASESIEVNYGFYYACLLYTSPSPRDQRGPRMPSSA